MNVLPGTRCWGSRHGACPWSGPARGRGCRQRWSLWWGSSHPARSTPQTPLNNTHWHIITVKPSELPTSWPSETACNTAEWYRDRRCDFLDQLVFFPIDDSFAPLCGLVQISCLRKKSLLSEESLVYYTVQQYCPQSTVTLLLLTLNKLKGTVSRYFLLLVFLWFSFSPAPEYSI